MGVSSNTEIAGKLRLVSPLGQGSAGQVWLAKHLHLGSEVAVKFLNREVSLSLTARERFVREARTIARIRSPHVVQVHDFGFHDDRAYLVMEHLVGETLEDRLARVGSLPSEQVVRVCTHIAKALQKAHDAGIIHRDIKPANVFLVDYGDEEVAKVVDFGIVKSQGGKLSASTLDTLTQTGSLLGTPYYMSPEQIQDSGHVSHQADLWALGVIAYECLLGRLPFEAENFALLVMAVCRDSVPVPSSIASVPPAFDAWIGRALQRDPEARFDSARELARELCQALLFPDASDTLSIPDGLLPPDLIWSGVFPVVKSPVRSTSEPHEQDDPTIAIRPSSLREDMVWEEVSRDSCKQEVGLRREASERDGSLDSQVSSKPPRIRFSRIRMPFLVAAGVALLAFGWFASQFVHSFAGPPTQQVAAPITSTTTVLDTVVPPTVASTPSLAPTPTTVESTLTVASAPTALTLTPSAASSSPPWMASPRGNPTVPTRKANSTVTPTLATSAPAATRPIDPLRDRH